MNEQPIHRMIFTAVNSCPEFYQWLSNNFLLGQGTTQDPSQALFNEGQRSVVKIINAMYAKCVEENERESSGQRDAGVGKAGKSGSTASRRATERFAASRRQT